MISEFKGEYEFLSNFYPCNVRFAGLHFKSSEAAFQSQKCPERASEFINLSPDEAKRLGKSVDLRPDWDDVKDAIMTIVVYNKFKQNKVLMKKLIATYPHKLVEGNTWRDNYWGVYSTGGLNKLGNILMAIRSIAIIKNDFN